MRAAASVLALSTLVACGDDSTDPPWQVVGRNMPAAILSVWGTAVDDVYAVGGDTGNGDGPLVLHFDGAAWTRLPTGETGNLWWVTGFADGPVFVGGDGGMILRYENGTFTRMTTPGTDTVFGIWGASPDDMWAVGGAIGGASGGFAWRLQGGTTWTPAAGFPGELAASSAIWKMYGTSASDAWMVGTNGALVRWDGDTLTSLSAGTGESLFTVHANADRYAAVGGFGTGIVLEQTGSAMWDNVSPPAVPGLVGVFLSATDGYAVGQEGAVLRRSEDGAWTEQDLGIQVGETFHSVWIDPNGGVWAAGGQVLTLPLVDGVLLYRGHETVGSIE